MATANTSDIDKEISKTKAERDAYLKSVGYANFGDIEKEYNRKKSGVAVSLPSGDITWDEIYNDALKTEIETAAKKNEDFEEKSKSQIKEVKYSYNKLSNMQTADNYDNVNYNIINGDQDAREFIISRYPVGTDTKVIDELKYDYLTDEERAVYNYIFETSGAKKASEYLSTLDATLRARRAKTEKANAAAFAASDPIGASIQTILQKPLYATLEAVATVGDSIDDGRIDTTSSLYGVSRTNDQIRATVEENIDNSVGKFFYRHGMNLADNTVAMALGGFGAGGTASKIITTGIQSLGSFSSTVRDASERGLSGGEAIALGLISAGAETFFESKTFDSLFDGKTLKKSTLSYLADNIKTELIGELSTEAINDIADALIAEDLSNWQLSVDKYMADGLSKEDALRETIWDWGKKYADVAGGTLFSSGTMAGTSALGNTIANHSNKKSYGESVYKNGNLAKVLDMASAYPEDSSVGKIYKRYSEKGYFKDGAKQKPVVIGNLADRMMENAYATLALEDVTPEQKESALAVINQLESFAKVSTKTPDTIKSAAESALENAIADVAKTNSAETGKLEATKADTAKRTIPLDDKKPKVTVATKDGGSVTVNGREFVTINGRGVYIVDGNQLGASQKYYAVDASTGKAIAASDTNKKLTNAVYDFMTEMKKPDSYIKDDIDSFEEYIDIASDIAVDKADTVVENADVAVRTADSDGNVEASEVDSPVEVDEAVSESGDEKIVVPEKKVDKVTYERAFTERKTTAVSESELSGNDVEVGKTITHSDLTQAVIDQALNSNDAATIKAAKDIQRRVYKNTDEMYRAVGRLAKAVGITGNDVIQSRAASIAQRYNDSNFGSTYAEFSNDLRQKFELAGDEIGIQALDYLDSIQAKSGQTGIDTVATDGVAYSKSNRNRVVENYISGIQYAFRANGNKNTRFEVYYDNSEGAKRGEWKVDRKGNVTIRINGTKVRGAESATWVLTHELFHGAAKNNPGIVDRVIDTFREIGIYDDSKFDAYKAEYEAAEGKELTDEYIKEEIAADLMMDVMGNEELTAMFAQKSTKEDLNFIARFFRRFVDAIKKVFDGNKKYQQYVYDAEKLLGVFERAIKSEANADVKRISSNELDTRYSLIYSGDIAKGQINYVENKKSYITEAELKDAQEVTRAMVDVMMKYSEILPEDKIGKVLTKNGSYDRSVENTTICVRTLAYNEFVDKVQEEIGRPLTQMESFLVSQKLYDIATEPQCLYCYVSLDRKAFNDMLLRYMQDRDTVIAKYNNSDKSPKAVTELYKEFLHGRKDTKEMKTRFDKWIGYVDNGTKLLSLADIATDANQKEIQSKGGNLAEQLKDARQYAQSASWSKIQKNYVAYRDEILKLGDRVVKNLNEHYGLRWYSFSDYSAAFIVENMQQITDASIRGLKGLAYTKDTDFVEIFASTGMNINVSVFVNQDADGNFFIDEKQSANFEKAVELRKKYPNVGIVATVTNDEALRWAGEQEWSDVIIPFHIVRTGTDVAEYYKWLNYTGESGDTIADKNLWDAYVDSLNLSSENARKKVSKNIYPSEHKNNKDTYLSLCESRGLSPRFVRFAGEAWYMKLVNETRLSADDSSSLKPEFNLDAAKDSFQKFIDKGGYEGGWYKEGVDVDAEAKTVADDVLAGKKANEVEYGRQDGFVPEDIIAKRKSNRTHGKSASTDVETKSAVTSTPANENSVFDDKQRKDVIRKLSAVAKQNGVARLDKDSFVTDAMGILEGALQTGIVSDGVVDELARCLYDYSREDAGDADLAGTYKDIRERINKVGKIYVPESVKNDIPDYDAFRKQFGTLLTTKDETALEVDKLYNDLIQI